MGRRPSQPARAGIADPRIRQPPKPLYPPRPEVRRPAEWSPAVATLARDVLDEASLSVVEEGHVDEKALPERIKNDLLFRRELYEQAIAILGMRPSLGTPPVVRAEARLKVWETLYRPGT